jgi:hypothetical protein
MTQQGRTLVVVVVVVAVLLALIAIAGIGRNPNTPLEQRDGRGHSAATITLIGTLLGVGLGLFGDRYLRHRGEVRCQVADFGASAHRRGPASAPHLKVEQTIHVYFFNEKEVDTGLSGITVVLVFESREEVALGPATRDYQTSTSPRGVINLPSKTWVSVDVKGAFYGRQAALLEQEKPKAVYIKATFPGGTPYYERCS